VKRACVDEDELGGSDGKIGDQLRAGARLQRRHLDAWGQRRELLGEVFERCVDFAGTAR